jgi:hypothetical protein
VLGLLVGAAIFGLTYQYVFPPIAKIANLGNVTLPTLWNIDPMLMAAIFCLFCLLLFYFLEHGLQRKDKLAD